MVAGLSSEGAGTGQRPPTKKSDETTSDDDEGKQAFREFLKDEFNAMFEYFTKEET